MNSYQENCSFISHSYSTRDEFLKEYNKLYNDKEKSRQLYIQILCELNVAICKGNLKSFKNISQNFKYILDTENEAEFSICLEEDTYPFKNTNVIILACKYNSLKILKYIFSNYTTIFERLFKHQTSTISPNDEDQNHHNAFYYSIRAGNTELLKMLINDWPGNYFENHLSELDEILSKAYKELKLKNILISESMEFFVEEKLINLRFFSSPSNKSQNNKISLNSINKRIELVMKQINSLNTINEVNEEFLLIIKYVALNIFTLKRQLKMFYNTLPWEEIEFTLICFISCNTEDKEINIFYRIVLNKIKILKYLNNFAKRLDTVKDELKNLKKISLLSSLPNTTYARIVEQIIKKYPEFEELYHDYQKIRDIYTLNEISNYVNLVSSANVRNQEGQLVVIRCIQAIGECLKNTLEAPKLSYTMSSLILLSLPSNTRKLVIDLRNSLSHAYSLARRTEILQSEQIDFFDGIKNDLKKIGAVIKGIFVENNLKTIKTILEGVANCKTVDELKQIVSLGTQFKLSTFSNLLKSEEAHLTEHEKFRYIIQKLKNIIPNKTEVEKLVLQEMENVVSSQNMQHTNTLLNYAVMINFFTTLKLIESTNSIDENVFRVIKYSCNTILNNLQKNLVQSKELKSLSTLSLKLINTLSLKQNWNEQDDVKKLIIEIICIIDIQLENVHWVDKLKDKLMECPSNNECDAIQTSSNRKDVLKNQLSLKLNELNKILSEHDLNKSLVNTTFENKQQVLAALEMLILEILSILGDFLNRLEDNLLFLDENVPLLIGKNLRNHLAHGNAILNIVPSNPTVGLVVSARKFAEELDKIEAKIGKSTTEDFVKLENEIDLARNVVSAKQKMFAALESGDFESSKSCLAQGSDVRARKNDSRSTLHAAAKGGNLDTVKFLVEQNVDVQAKSYDGKTPLHVAAQFGHANLIEFFLKQKYYVVNCADESLKTPLHLAALNNHKLAVEALLKYSASCSAQDILGCSPLHYAIQRNHRDVAQLLLKREKHVDANEARGGFTPLHMASERGHLELVKLLLNRGANVEAETDGRTTPLHLASLNGHVEVVEALVQKKSDVNARVLDGCTPLHYATEHGHKKIVDVLLKNGADPNVADKTYKNTPLLYAAQDGYVDIAQELIRHKAYINATDVQGKTPLFYAIGNGHLEIVEIICQRENTTNNVQFALHLAVEHGHFNIVEYLIGRKMDVDVTDDNGSTPLHYAAFKGLKNIVVLLLKNKAKINAKNETGSTPLLEAVSMDIDEIAGVNLPANILKLLKQPHVPHVDNLLRKKGKSVKVANEAVEKDEVVNILLESGADVNVKRNDGTSAMHLAALSGRYSIVNLLINRGVPVNAKTSFGGTPLILATMLGHKEVVLLLLANGADVHCVDAMGFSALHAACTLGHCDIVKILLQNNANVNAANNANLTPLCLAVNGNHIDIVKALTEKKTEVRVTEKDLLAAIENNNSDVLKILLHYKRFVMKSLVKHRDHEMTSLLHFALLKSSDAIIITLIENGADVNSKSIGDSAPLHIAVLHQREKLVKLLLDKGADVNCKTFDGATLLHAAAINGNPRVVEILLQYRIDVNARDFKNRTALELAVADGHLQMVQLLLPRVKTKINGKAYNGFTLLHIAAQWNHVEVIKYLVENGADINIRNEGGSKPIHIGAREGFEETVKYFLSLGQDVNELGASNSNLLHTCTVSGNLKLAEYLIKEGAHVNARSQLGRTPLHMAVHWNTEVEFLKLLLDHGATYNPVDCYGARPSSSNPATVRFFSLIDDLFKATKRNDAAEVKRCVEAGVAANALNADNVTALHFASWKGYDQVVAELAQSKGVVNALGKSGFTALHYAAKYSHFGVCKTLLAAGAIHDHGGANGKTPLDFSASKDVTELLATIKSCFEKVSRKDTSIVAEVKRIKDVSVVKALMNARNSEGKVLIAVAILNDFPKVSELKEILQDGLAGQIDKADSMMILERYDDALKIYESVLKARTDLLGKNNPGTLDIQAKIGAVLYKQQKYQLALDMHQDIYDKQKDWFGENSKESLNTRSTIALILHRQGKNEEALAIFRRVYEKQKEILTLDDRDFLNTHVHMGLVLNALGKFDEALTMNTKVLEQRRNKFGSDHLDTLVAQNNIAMVLASQGKYDQAEKMYRKVYESRKKLLGPNHSDTLRAFYNIVAVLHEQKKYSEASEAYEEVLNVQKSSLGPDHIDTLNTQFSMGILLFQRGKHLGALKIFNACLPGLRSKLGPSHEKVRRIEVMMEGINQALQRCGQSDLVDVVKNVGAEARLAASSGDPRGLKHALGGGVDVNEADEEGRTLLHFAADGGSLEVARVLLNSGCDLTRATRRGNTALHTAVSGGHERVVEELLGHASRAQLRRLVDARTTAGGTTALHVAARAGRCGIAKTLLKHGAAYAARNNEGKTPLELAEEESVARLLKLVGECFEAAARGDAEVVGMLRKMKKDEFLAVTNARDERSFTIEEVAAAQRDKKFAKEFLTAVRKIK